MFILIIDDSFPYFVLISNLISIFSLVLIHMSVSLPYSDSLSIDVSFTWHVLIVINASVYSLVYYLLFAPLNSALLLNFIDSFSTNALLSYNVSLHNYVLIRYIVSFHLLYLLTNSVYSLPPKVLILKIGFIYY